MSWCDEWNAISDQCRDHMNDEFIDLAGVEKGSDDSGAAHHPDVFSFRSTQAPGELVDRFIDELDTLDLLFGRTPSEDIVSDVLVKAAAEASAHVAGKVCGISSPKNRVDRLVESAHAVITRRVRLIKPVDGAVFAGDEAISAGSNVDNDLSHLHWPQHVLIFKPLDAGNISRPRPH